MQSEANSEPVEDNQEGTDPAKSKNDDIELNLTFELIFSKNAGSVWASPGKDDDVLKKFDDVTSPLHEGKSLKRK